MNRRLAGTAIHVLALIGCSGKTPTPPTSLPPPPTSSTPTCTYAVSPLAVSTGQDGEPGTMAVQTTAGCPWTARSNTGWITVTAGNSRSGNGSLDYSVQATFDTNARTGTLTVADMAVTVTQSAFSSSFSSPFVGRWRNADPETESITRVSIRGSGNAFVVHMWASCDPECYWGDAQTSRADADDGVLALAWDFFAGTIQRTQELQVVQDGRLRVISHTRFTDGRQPYDSVDYFSRSAE
jgi:Viral BACON domain